MPPMQSEPESSKNSKAMPVREDRRPLNLPEFDSLPAIAGLSNTEAFRLSIQHALAMLPAMLAQEKGARESINTERFSLR
jgi:hypothetical protein